jgi:predicted lipoprotein with Yx(FWY)xxD motif
MSTGGSAPAGRSTISRFGAWGMLAVLGMVAVAGSMVQPGLAGAATTPTTITTTHNKTWGTILVLQNGTTVYRLAADSKNKSVCSGACATIWPPVLLAAGQKSPVGHGVHGLGTITRASGKQVTYQGVPLYRFVGDQKPGQATGDLKDTWGRWWVVNPANPHVAPTASHRTGGASAPTTVAGSGAAY